jgi:hypothetical protein
MVVKTTTANDADRASFEWRGHVHLVTGGLGGQGHGYAMGSEEQGLVHQEE